MEEQGFFATLLSIFSIAAWMAFYYTVVVLLGMFMIGGALWLVDIVTGSSLRQSWNDSLAWFTNLFRKEEGAVVIVQEAETPKAKTRKPRKPVSRTGSTASKKVQPTGAETPSSTPA